MGKDKEVKSIEDLDEDLCIYCPIEGPVNTNQFNLCEGCRCDEAYERYLDTIDEED